MLNKQTLDCRFSKYYTVPINLLNGAMKLKDYLDSLERGGAARLAERLGISSSYLSQLAHGLSPISPARCVEIENATEKNVTRKDLRDDWQAIWPELADGYCCKTKKKGGRSGARA